MPVKPHSYALLVERLRWQCMPSFYALCVLRHYWLKITSLNSIDHRSIKHRHSANCPYAKTSSRSERKRGGRLRVVAVAVPGLCVHSPLDDLRMVGYRRCVIDVVYACSACTLQSCASHSRVQVNTVGLGSWNQTVVLLSSSGDRVLRSLPNMINSRLGTL